MRITGLKKKLISLIVAVIMTVSGMYVENINIDSSFAYEDTANQNFTQAVHLSKPSESCTEELLGNRETGRIAAGYRRLTEKSGNVEEAALSLAAVLPENLAGDSWNFDLWKLKDVLDSRSVIIGYIHHQDGAKG